jgi:hypothetical protein
MYFQEEQDPRKCLNESKDVSLCAIDFFRKVRDTCNDTKRLNYVRKIK